MMNTIISLFESYALKVPLSLFASLGAFIEEVIAPIPSPLVMTLTGSILGVQQGSVASFLGLAFIAAIGKTLGSVLVYVISDKAEDVVIGKFGKILGVTHKEIESIGKYFKGGIKDDIILFIARALPIMPTAPVSIVCGVIKLNMRTYITSTFLGTFVRNMIYLYIGYTGLSTYHEIAGGLNGIESVIQILLGVVLLAFVIWAYHRRRKQNAMETIQNLVFKMRKLVTRS